MNSFNIGQLAHIDHEMTELSKCCLRPKYTNNKNKNNPPTVCFYYDYKVSTQTDASAYKIILKVLHSD